jgi:hypothetical protein
MYIPIHTITVNGSIQINKVLEVHIQKTLSSFTNNCSITLPKYLRYNNKPVFTDFESNLFKKGDVFSVKLGYQYQTNIWNTDEQFYGFLANIEILENTVILHLEDYAYWLKLAVFNYVDASTTLTTLGNKLKAGVNALIPSGVQPINIQIGKDFPITDFKASYATGTQILDLLKGNYLLDSYFIKNTLVLGINFSAISNTDPTKIKSFSTFKSSLIKTVSPNKFYKILNMANLKFKHIDDLKLNITLKTITNGKVQENYFDTNGKISTVQIQEGNHLEFVNFNASSISQMESFVQNQIKRIRYTGFMKGSSFTTYGLPSIEVKDVIAFDGVGFIRNFNQSVGGYLESIYERTSYLVDGVNISFTNQGFRQEVILSNKVATKYSSTSLVDLLKIKTIPSEQ